MTDPAARCVWCAKRHEGGPERCLWGWALVCGGRSFSDRTLLFATLDRLADRMELFGIRHGGASGADELAGAWALERSYRVDACPADWDRHGRAAGPIRNAHMLEKEPRPVCCVAFPGGRGTRDMASKCERAGVPVWRVGWR